MYGNTAASMAPGSNRARQRSKRRHTVRATCSAEDERDVPPAVAIQRRHTHTYIHTAQCEMLTWQDEVFQRRQLRIQLIDRLLELLCQIRWQSNASQSLGR